MAVRSEIRWLACACEAAVCLFCKQASCVCVWAGKLGDPGLVERRALRTVRAEVDGGPSRRGTVIAPHPPEQARASSRMGGQNRVYKK